MTPTPTPSSVAEPTVGALRDLLEQCRLRISNMDPLALRIDQALRGPSDHRGGPQATRPCIYCGRYHDDGDRLLSESAHRILREVDDR